MHAPRFLIFTLVLSALLYAVNRHAFRWLTRLLPLSRGWRLALIAVLVIAPAAVVLGRLLRGVVSGGVVGRLLVAAGGLELAVLLSVVLLVLFEGAIALAGRARRLMSPSRSRGTEPQHEAPVGTSSPTEAAAPPQLNRREFVVRAAAGSAFTIGASTAMYGVFHGRHDYALEEVPIEVKGLSTKFDGFSIVQLSDIHIGTFVGDGELSAVESIVRGARADLIVLTGDLVDHDFRFADRLGAFTRRLVPLARAGVVAISGNHDFYAGITPIVRALGAAGARVLQNRGEVVSDGDAGFALLGVDDVWGRRFGGTGPDLSRAIASLGHSGPLASRARDLPRILLCHNPKYFEEAAGRVSLQLSGHTHGGQVNPLVRPADWVLPHGWVAGRYRLRDSDLYVNRGLGTVGPPARIGAAPEITRIVLTT